MYGRFFKRAIDFTAALAGLAVLWPIMAAVAFGVWATTGGSPFFFQTRPGRGEKLFRVYKFKTMTDATDRAGNLLPDRERLTRIGRFLRKTSLDETPQLINVLRGDMALVGPRPLLVKYLPYYTSRERLRHTVRPGITGWAQVCGRNMLGWDERLDKDVWYVEHLSLRLDAEILWLTFKKTLQRKDVVIDTGSFMKNLDEERSKDGIVG